MCVCVCVCVCVLVRSDADVWRVQGGRMETKAKAAGRKNNRCVWWRGVGIGVGVDVCVCVCVCVYWTQGKAADLI
jgi:hypothetical protein